MRFNDTESAFGDFVRYVDSYDEQSNWKNYPIYTFVNDMVYGLGIALEPNEHYGPDGYISWMRRLRAHLEVEIDRLTRGNGDD